MATEADLILAADIHRNNALKWKAEAAALRAALTEREAQVAGLEADVSRLREWFHRILDADNYRNEGTSGFHQAYANMLLIAEDALATPAPDVRQAEARVIGAAKTYLAERMGFDGTLKYWRGKQGLRELIDAVEALDTRREGK